MSLYSACNGSNFSEKKSSSGGVVVVATVVGVDVLVGVFVAVPAVDDVAVCRCVL